MSFFYGITVHVVSFLIREVLISYFHLTPGVERSGNSPIEVELESNRNCDNIQERGRVLKKQLSTAQSGQHVINDPKNCEEIIPANANSSVVT